MPIALGKRGFDEGRKVIRALDDYRRKSSKQVFLPQLLGLANAQAPYKEWCSALRETTKKFINGRKKGDAEASKLCRDLLQKNFQRENTWRRLLNVLGRIYIDKNIMALAVCDGDVQYIAENYRFLIKTVRDVIGSPDAEEVIKDAMEEKGIRVKDIWHEIKQIEEDLEQNSEEIQLIKKREKLRQQQEYIKQQKYLQETLIQAEKKRLRKEEERRLRNAEIQPGTWRLESTHPAIHQISAFFPHKEELIFYEDKSVTGSLFMNMMGELNLTCNISGGWNYDYNFKTLDLNLTISVGNMSTGNPLIDIISGFMNPQQFAGNIPQMINQRLTITRGSNGVYECTDNEGRPFRLIRLG